MQRSAEESTSFLLQYLWTGFVLLLVIGGLWVAVSRGDMARQSMDGATLAGSAPYLLR